MAAASSSALMEAQQERSKGEQALKTGVFKWSPDYTGASSAFARAGDAFKRGGKLKDAVECWVAAADAHAKDGRPSGAAVTLGKAASAMELDAGASKSGGTSLIEVAGMFDRVSAAYLSQPDMIRAAEFKAKAGLSAAKGGDGPGAEGRLKEAADLFEAVPDRAIYATKPLAEGADLLVKLGHHKGAMQVFDRLMTFQERCNQLKGMYGVILSRVVLLLHAGDQVAAKAEFEGRLGLDGFMSSTEGAAADDLISACTGTDPDLVKAVTSKRVFGYLGRSVTALARALAPAADELEEELGVEAGGDGDGETTATSKAAANAAASMAAKSGQSASAAASSGHGGTVMEIPGMGTVVVHEYGGGGSGGSAKPGEDEAARKAREEDNAARAALFAAPSKGKSKPGAGAAASESASATASGPGGATATSSAAAGEAEAEADAGPAVEGAEDLGDGDDALEDLM